MPIVAQTYNLVYVLTSPRWTNRRWLHVDIPSDSKVKTVKFVIFRPDCCITNKVLRQTLDISPSVSLDFCILFPNTILYSQNFWFIDFRKISCIFPVFGLDIFTCIISLDFRVFPLDLGSENISCDFLITFSRNQIFTFVRFWKFITVLPVFVYRQSSPQFSGICSCN